MCFKNIKNVTFVISTGCATSFMSLGFFCVCMSLKFKVHRICHGKSLVKKIVVSTTSNGHGQFV